NPKRHIEAGAPDKYGRPLTKVYGDDGTDIGDYLIRSGNARQFMDENNDHLAASMDAYRQALNAPVDEDRRRENAEILFQNRGDGRRNNRGSILARSM